MFAHLFNNTNNGHQWDTPIPVSGSTTTPPTFPAHTLPQWMTEQAEQVAKELQVAVDLPATLGLVALSIIFSGKYHIQVRNTWKESCNLYLVVALPPGAGKSPAFTQMLSPIRKYDLEQADQARTRIEHVAQKRRMIEKAMKRAEEKGDHMEASQLLYDLEKHPEVVVPRLIADDATPEALVEMMSKQGGRLALISTEGGPFELMAGRYSDRANLDVYLKAFSGDTIIVDRVGRGATSVANPHLTVGLTVQPDVVRSLADHPELAGRGLTARFMYSVPIDLVGKRDMMLEYDTNQNIIDLYDHRLRTFLHAHNAHTDTQPITVDKDALHLYASTRQALENQRGEDGALKVIAEWTTKLESSIMRVAGLLALADNKHNIDLPIMRRAVEIGEYWLAHAHIVHDMWGANEVLRDARAVLKWLAQKDDDNFSVRDLHRAMSRRFVGVEECKPVLELLTERGWIRPLFEGALIVNKRGVESPRYVVNPANKTQMIPSLRTNP